ATQKGRQLTLPASEAARLQLPVTATAAVESSTAATTVEPTAATTVEATAPTMESAASSTAVEAARAAVESAATGKGMSTTHTAAEAVIAPADLTAAISPAAVSVPTPPAAAAVPAAVEPAMAPIAVVPGSGTDEDAAEEPTRSVVAVRSASVRVIRVVAIRAPWSRAVVIRWILSVAVVVLWVVARVGRAPHLYPDTHLGLRARYQRKRRGHKTKGKQPSKNLFHMFPPSTTVPCNEPGPAVVVRGPRSSRMVQRLGLNHPLTLTHPAEESCVSQAQPATLSETMRKLRSNHAQTTFYGTNSTRIGRFFAVLHLK
ncbi:MAG: hypothetical protein QOF90_1171, partial [Acetobacteraceae bacterium]|nr:hypothetical protein [Acetobacteraceae bacterium]